MHDELSVPTHETISILTRSEIEYSDSDGREASMRRCTIAIVEDSSNSWSLESYWGSGSGAEETSSVGVTNADTEPRGRGTEYCMSFRWSRNIRSRNMAPSGTSRSI